MKRAAAPGSARCGSRTRGRENDRRQVVTASEARAGLAGGVRLFSELLDPHEQRDRGPPLRAWLGPLSGTSSGRRRTGTAGRRTSYRSLQWATSSQIWRVIGGIESHRAGDGFLAGYRRHGENIQQEFER